MPLKHDWEKADMFTSLEASAIERMAQLALPHLTLASYDIISGGCANLNIRLIFADNAQPYILRIYVRDIDSVYREKKIAELLKSSVPVAQIYFIGDCDGYRFAIMEHMPGINFRELILDRKGEDIQYAASQAGMMLAEFQKIVFDRAGFFDQNLHVVSHLNKNDYIKHLRECLERPAVIAQLGTEKIARIERMVDKFASYFPEESDHCLVHGDYDPSNILVDNINGRWQITAILDFEFVFSGSWLCDVANMVRYAYQLPPDYEKAFLKGVAAAGLTLPPRWRITTHLLNMLSLLNCLVACPPLQRPNQCADVCSVIEHILEQLEKAD